ncbi:rNA-metabolising metallo-beta-lactamase [Clostridium sp. CAG:492]|nr:rNA-metabolising metallo-beta-lactamase [Clostridium sp. CAG:492]
MKVTFCGATKTVTGSNFLVEGAGKKFLVDCGLYQGGAKDEIKNEEPFPYDINEIDFMLLTHAHIDHSGRIPKLYKEGYRNPIYATNATCDLCAIMLPDSGHIQETETEWKNRKRIRRGEEELVPIYDAETAAKSLELFKGEPYNQIIELDDDIHVRFNDAGHMLGSSTIEIWIRENGENKKIVFSGDLGNNDIPLLAEPTMIQDADFLVMESTYGNRLHIKNENKAKTFINIVTDTIKNGGTVVIPSFAVGRTQEILYELNKIKDSEDDSPEFERKYRLLMNTPVYVDSPLAISATEVFKENMDLFDEETQELIKRGDNPLEFPGLKFTQTVEESKALNESDESAIIISASGMCEVGRIKHHLKHNIWNPKNTILFVGYQAPGTLGRKIVDGAKTVKIFGEEIAVNARVEYIEGYSGHADQAGLLHFVDSFVKKPNHIFLVHGEEESQKALRDKINENFDLPVSIPDYCESFDLTNTVQATGNIRKRNLNEYKKLEVIDRMETLKEELMDMESIVKEDILANTVNDDEISKLNERIKALEKQIVEIVENK